MDVHALSPPATTGNSSSLQLGVMIPVNDQLSFFTVPSSLGVSVVHHHSMFMLYYKNLVHEQDRKLSVAMKSPTYILQICQKKCD